MTELTQLSNGYSQLSGEDQVEIVVLVGQSCVRSQRNLDFQPPLSTNNAQRTTTFTNPIHAGTLPSQLGRLTKVSTFDLWGNSISSSIPTELGGLTKATIFDLNSNQV